MGNIKTNETLLELQKNISELTQDVNKPHKISRQIIKTLDDLFSALEEIRISDNATFKNTKREINFLHDSLEDHLWEIDEKIKNLETEKIKKENRLKTLEDKSNPALSGSLEEINTNLNNKKTEWETQKNKVETAYNNRNLSPNNQNTKNIYFFETNKLKDINTEITKRENELNRREKETEVLPKEIENIENTITDLNKKKTEQEELKIDYEKINKIAEEIEHIKKIGDLNIEEKNSNPSLLKAENLLFKQIPSGSRNYSIMTEKDKSVSWAEIKDILTDSGETITIKGLEINSTTGELSTNNIELINQTTGKTATLPQTINLQISATQEIKSSNWKRDIKIKASKKIKITINKPVLVSSNQTAIISSFQSQIETSAKTVYDNKHIALLDELLENTINSKKPPYIALSQQTKDALKAEIINNEYNPISYQAINLQSDCLIAWSFLEIKNFNGNDEDFKKHIQNELRWDNTNWFFSKAENLLKAKIQEKLSSKDAAITQIINGVLVWAEITPEERNRNRASSVLNNFISPLLTNLQVNSDNYFGSLERPTMKIRWNQYEKLKSYWKDTQNQQAQKLVMKNITDNNYMSFFEGLDNEKNPLINKEIELPDNSKINISTGLVIHSLDTMTAEIKISWSENTILPKISSQGRWLLGIIEAILKQEPTKDKAKNQIILTHCVIDLYKILIKKQIEKTGEMRVWDSSITISGNDELIVKHKWESFNENTLKKTGKYENIQSITKGLPLLSDAFNSIMKEQNTDFIEGIENQKLPKPRSSLLSKRRYKKDEFDFDFKQDNINCYYKNGELLIELADWFTIPAKPTENRDEIFTSPLLYGKQHEIMKVFYEKIIEKLLAQSRIKKHTFAVNHNGRTFVIANTKKNSPKPIFGEIENSTGLPVINNGTINETQYGIIHWDWKNMLTNPKIMNEIISSMIEKL